ncbi:alpha/beta fold hydrolase [Brevundimonas variabilis]|uniref:Pimeloyl-ACP methyl ester carboxylesterase n=1 Tax=Brevundimonas variabilis TaxID=74312 RepID=A0A7W9CK40_9CAUL|nr:alpha/beta hydrolase [Brevundimonas variabilis]MBB5747158.1 pimeloyl-ACP methyl ester carboxylesterase [Brevundimonas variabilis]
MFRAILTTTAVAAVLGLTPVAAMAQESHGTSAAAHGHHHAAFESERLHVRVDGEGPRDIVLIPGLSSSPEVWDSTVAHLGTGWRVHRIHVQGFAGAPAKANAEGDVAAPVAEEIARYIREAGLSKPVVVGHSMGGTMGMMLAARHPDLVGKLMVVDMVPFMGAMFGAPGVTAEQVRPIADQIHAGMSAGPDEAYQAQAAAAVTGMINTESLRAGPLEDARTSDRRVSANAYRELIVTDLRAELPKITAPTEVVYVKFNDPRMTPEITDMIYQSAFATLPGATLKRIDDAAHFVMFDQPGAFFAELDAFIAR